MIKIPTLANTNLGTYAAYSDETYMFEGRTGDRWWLVSGDIKGGSKKLTICLQTLSTLKLTPTMTC